MQNGLTVFLKLSFICLRIKHHFYINGFALWLRFVTGNGPLYAVSFVCLFLFPEGSVKIHCKDGCLVRCSSLRPLSSVFISCYVIVN